MGLDFCKCDCCRELDSILAEYLSTTLNQLEERLKALQPAERTDPRLDRLAELETQLADMDAGDRARAIQKRMRLSKSTYYRLRMQLLLSPTESHVSRGTGI